MAWFGLDKLFLGTDLDAEQKRSDQLDAQLAAANQELVARKVWTQKEWAAFEADTTGPNSTFGQNVTSQVNTAFGEGFNEGVDNVRNFLSKSINVGIGTPLKLIPWQVWLLGAVALFVYFGGLGWLRQKVKL
jgi:hypothetical protein